MIKTSRGYGSDNEDNANVLCSWAFAIESSFCYSNKGRLPEAIGPIRILPKLRNGCIDPLELHMDIHSFQKTICPDKVRG